MFKDEWLRMDKYSSWVRKSSKCTEFRCNLCETNCKLSDLGSAALDSHAKGQKHQARVQSKERSKMFFAKPQASSKQAESSPSASNSQSLSPSASQAYFNQSSQLNAEIIWTLYCTSNNISDRSNDNISPTLKAMFPDSRELQIKKDRTKYIRNFGLAPHSTNKCPQVLQPVI